jgi:hypothetical protein
VDTHSRYRVTFTLWLVCSPLCSTYGGDLKSALDDAKNAFGGIPAQFREYKVILEPDKDEPEWWAGAPSMTRDRTGTFWLACRMRTADSPRGLRGYEIRILRSGDGIHFEKVCSIRRADVPIPGFERPALLADALTGKFKLYACGPWRSGPWSIIKFDDVNDPAQFDPASARVVIATGVGFTFDLHHITDLTPDSPLVVSTTPSEHFRTWRYSHWIWVGEELWAYAEVARPNESSEIRLFRLPR